MKTLRPIAIVLTFAVTVIVIQRLSGMGTAPVPEVFAAGLSLDGAIERGRAEKKPVLVFATADWCGPCQVMKRTVLSEPGIEQQIARDFVPAYVDLDKEKAAAERLKVFSIPATLILWDGRQVARMEGVVPHDSYQTWLEAAHAQAVSDTPFIERASDEFIRNLNASTEANATAAPTETPGPAESPSGVPHAPPH
ncbi:MAG: thioredoxin family protein [Phycisphaeraceae bacterium]|nr:thioredoxin family protein [Phycisphaeraceae bacterium]